MRHDWVFDVLSDLLTYATQNGLPRLAAKVSESIDVAQSNRHRLAVARCTDVYPLGEEVAMVAGCRPPR
jgi:hypothetical protein